MIGNPYEREARPLIDFSLMKPKTDPAVVQK
jgi:heptose-I-phosphate ethanolaminephosphotransferase